MKDNKLESYIYIIKNAISNELCDQILNEYMNCNDWQSTKVGSGANLDKSIRNCEVIGISFLGIIKNNEEIRSKLDNSIFESAANCIKKYKEKYPSCEIVEDNGYELLKYSTGGFYIEHTDSFKERPRSISCSFALNDDYEGGEFAFFNKELKYKLEKGDALMFPSNFMFPHEVMPITKGVRYSIITWFV